MSLLTPFKQQMLTHATRPTSDGEVADLRINAGIVLYTYLFGWLAALLWSATAVVYWFVFLYGVIV